MNAEASLCPICGQPNDCRMANGKSYKGPCWCEGETFPQELLEKIPEERRRQACICRSCVVKAKRKISKKHTSPRIGAGDFYIEGEYIVLTAQYLRRRGYCCGNGCRHCPYDDLEKDLANEDKLQEG